MIIGLVTSVIITRNLGPEGRGIFAMTVIIGAIGVQIGNLGLHGSNTFYVAKNPDTLPSLLGNSILISIVLGSLLVGVAALFFFFYPELAPAQGSLLYLGLVWIPPGLAYLLIQNLLLGIQEFHTFNKIELFSKFVFLLLVGLIIFFNISSVTTIFTGSLIALVLSLAWSLRMIYPFLAHRISLSYSMFKRSIHYGIKSYLGSLFAFLLLRIDLLMVNEILGKEEAGWYDISVILAEMIYVLPIVVFTILFPKLCAMENIQNKWQLTKDVGAVLMVAMGIISVLIWFLAGPIIEILYGEAFLAAASVFILLVLGKSVICMSQVFGNFVASINVPWTAIPFGFLLVLINIQLNLIFIEHYGMIGAALASIICFSLLIPFNFYYCAKYLRHQTSPNS